MNPETFFGLLLAVIFICVLALEQQDAGVELKLAADYANMLEREAACKTWECISNIGAE